MLNKIYSLTNKPKLTEGVYLFLLSCFCLALSLVRVYLTNSNTFLFLNWNLFLAFVPWCVSSLVLVSHKLKNSRFIIGFMLFTWLLFFPNAPYILTDLFHLRLQSSMPIWFDLVLILAFAWSGLLFGFLSLFDIERIIKERFNFNYISVFSSLMLFVTAFGIYMGRFLRWNSWDIISKPTAIITDISSRFINPLEHPRTWGVTIFMGLLLNMIYWSLKLLKKRKI